MIIIKIYDISQEIFTCSVYPGDPAPQRSVLNSISNGELYNLTAFSMCAHNGTHIDAPFHFLNEGKTVDQLDLAKLVGQAFVISHDGIITEQDAKRILKEANEADVEAAKRILIKGNAVLSLEAAKIFADAKLELFGNESQTVGPEDAPMEVHKLLLGAETVLLEGIRTSEAAEGESLLSAAPINLGGSDGSPVRALLIDGVL